MLFANTLVSGNSRLDLFMQKFLYLLSLLLMLLVSQSFAAEPAHDTTPLLKSVSAVAVTMSNMVDNDMLSDDTLLPAGNPDLIETAIDDEVLLLSTASFHPLRLSQQPPRFPSPAFTPPLCDSLDRPPQFLLL